MDFQSFLAAQPNDDDHLADLGAKVQMTGVTGENSATPVLVAGKPGLRFFADFGPAYTKLTGANHDYQQHIANRYDEQGDINYAHLRADAERYTHIQSEVDDTLNSVRNNGNSVFGSWRGAAADAANARFTEFLDQGRQTLTQFGMLADVITVVVDAVDRICYEKAAAVRSLCAGRIGPCDRSDVNFLVDFATRCSAGDFSDDELARAANLCGVDINPALCRLTPQIFEKVAEDVNGWLASIFVPFYEARLAKFDAACTAAKDVLATAWTGLEEALLQVRADPFGTTTPASTTETAQASGPGSQAPSGMSGESGGRVDVFGGDPAPVPGAGVSGTEDEHNDLSTGRSELMAPSAAVGPVAPPPIATVAPAAPAATQHGGYAGYGYYGVPFTGAAGGGDRDRHRSLPIAGERVFAESEPADGIRADDDLVIGGATDTTVYNEEAAEPESAKDIQRPEPDDEEDLW